MKKICPPSRSLVFAVFFFLLALASAMIIRPFFSVMVMSAILAYVSYPAYSFLQRKLRSQALGAGIVVLLMILLLLVPLGFIVAKLTTESLGAYKSAKDYFEGDGFSGYCEIPRLGCETYESLAPIAEKYGVDLKGGIRNLVFLIFSGLVKYVSGIALSIPLYALIFFFIMFITYYLLKEGKGWLEQLKNKLPLDPEVKQDIVKKFNDVLYATIYGAIILSIIQGILATIGFWIIGAPAPILFGFLTMIATFIPFIGGALVWGPLSFWMIFQGISTGYTTLVFQGLAVFTFGLIVVSTIDNLLKPKVVGRKAHMHPLLILLGVFGGIAVFGVMGIVIGPVILALFMTALEIYEKEMLQ